MEYINRDMEAAFLRIAKQFKCVMVTGPRQVGKTTMMRRLMAGTDRKYVSLDDLMLREFAKTDPRGFIDAYAPPVFIDEVQYAPELFSFIKMQVDGRQQPGDYWLSGSQIFRLMRGVNESLAGRVGLLELFPLSQNEIFNHYENFRFPTDFGSFIERGKQTVMVSGDEIYSRIWRGSMPSLIGGEIKERTAFYESYIRTYLERDVRDLSGNIDVLKFYRFITAAAARVGQLLNYKSLADDADIDQATAKNWLNILETIGLIFYLHPYSNNLLKRTIKSPKLYFYDSGLASYLARWNGAAALMNGAQGGAILENYVVSEIMKSYHNAGERPSINYYRDKDDKEIDIVIEENGTLLPLEIKKTASPDSRLTEVFRVLEKSGKRVGNGAVLCTASEPLPINSQNWCVPVSLI